jgi:hypothetical protein
MTSKFISDKSESEDTTFSFLISKSRSLSSSISSQLENKQRQLVNKSHTFDWIILAYLAIAGHGHYDACIKPAIAGRTQLQNSPSKTVEETANMRNTHAFLTISFYV